MLRWNALFVALVCLLISVVSGKKADSLKVMEAHHTHSHNSHAQELHSHSASETLSEELHLTGGLQRRNRASSKSNLRHSDDLDEDGSHHIAVERHEGSQNSYRFMASEVVAQGIREEGVTFLFGLDAFDCNCCSFIPQSNVNKSDTSNTPDPVPVSEGDDVAPVLPAAANDGSVPVENTAAATPGVVPGGVVTLLVTTLTGEVYTVECPCCEIYPRSKRVKPTCGGTLQNTNDADPVCIDSMRGAAIALITGAECILDIDCQEPFICDNSFDAVKWVRRGLSLVPVVATVVEQGSKVIEGLSEARDVLKDIKGVSPTNLGMKGLKKVWNPTPGGSNKCGPKRRVGDRCYRDSACISGKCNKQDRQVLRQPHSTLLSTSLTTSLFVSVNASQEPMREERWGRFPLVLLQLPTEDATSFPSAMMCRGFTPINACHSTSRAPSLVSSTGTNCLSMPSVTSVTSARE
jgi:hypothetical protein